MINEFLRKRPRRLRSNPTIRALTAEHTLQSTDFIMPVFLVEGKNKKEEIPSMPGQYRYSIDELLKELAVWTAPTPRPENALRAVLLFGIVADQKKDATGSIALKKTGIVPMGVRAIKKHFPELLVITDLCFCEYTSHGHCGIIAKTGKLDNDATLEILAKQAIVHAEAGADIIAPSGMIDGMVAAIRSALDENKNKGFNEVGIMSYAVKYASAYYGPFREAVQSRPDFGDRKAYQMQPANAREALREAELDISQGADILMVKPGMPYLDIVSKLNTYHLPIAVYQVSGEYAMIKAAAEKGYLNESEIMWESLLAMKRAGARLIISYYAVEAIKRL